MNLIVNESLISPHMKPPVIWLWEFIIIPVFPILSLFCIESSDTLLNLFPTCCCIVVTLT